MGKGQSRQAGGGANMPPGMCAVTLLLSACLLLSPLPLPHQDRVNAWSGQPISANLGVPHMAAGVGPDTPSAVAAMAAAAAAAVAAVSWVRG